MKKLLVAAFTLLSVNATSAKGFDWFFAHVHPTGRCDHEVVASWYSIGHHTANGETFNSSGLTAAHRTLPFGTMVHVTNPHNGRAIAVRINDRGPFVRGVTLDLTHGAATAIGMTGTQYVCMH